ADVVVPQLVERGLLSPGGDGQDDVAAGALPAEHLPDPVGEEQVAGTGEIVVLRPLDAGFGQVDWFVPDDRGVCLAGRVGAQVLQLVLGRLAGGQHLATPGLDGSPLPLVLGELDPTVVVAISVVVRLVCLY